MFYSSLEKNNGTLHKHQIEAKEKVFIAWDKYNSVMLQMPTGTGKTYLFTSIIKDLLSYYKKNHIELNILIVAHRTELLEQISNSLTRFSIPHGFIQGNREQHLWQRVQVGSIMSLLTCKNEMNVIRLDFNYIIIDEAHHSLSDTYKRLFDTFPKAKKLGVTATPWRFNHESFLSLYETLITTPQISWFIKEGLLADFDYVSIKPDCEIQQMINNTKVAITGDYANEELDACFNNQRIRSKLYNSYKHFAYGKKGIVYAINKEHAANVANMYCSKGIKAVAIDCDTPKDERKILIEEFRKGNITILVNVEIFTEGFDCPDINFIQLARPTRSLALYLQQVGRGLRIVEGKEKTIILDNVGLYNYFGLPNANRHWQYHFIGHELSDDIYKNDNGFSLESEMSTKERNYDEDDEEMLIIKGAEHIKTKQKTSPTQIENRKQQEDPIIEFSLCDYYYIRGNKHHFKIYPFIKKKGMRTEDIGQCLYTYDEKSNEELKFDYDTIKNLQLLSKHIKIQTIISFASYLIGISLSQALNIKWLFNNTNVNLTSKNQGKINLFHHLKLLEELYKRNSLK